ncbi:MAG: hypothetical protein F6K41_06905 [Symploca sp. SIO3E6]|nr:hypothetical protein [Caldora sp. SIO3E6]
MADINVNFVHPTDGRMLTVNLDDSITAQEAVAELIAADFITPNSQGYGLAIKGGNMIEPGKTFREAEVQEPNHNTIRVVPATDAGI